MSSQILSLMPKSHVKASELDVSGGADENADINSGRGQTRKRRGGRSDGVVVPIGGKDILFSIALSSKINGN